MTLSYIIPAYNVSDFIEKCLYSIVKQGLTVSAYEIIIINDGSTDDTTEKVETFIKNNDEVQITYCYQKNAGQSSARNRALLIAKGDYIWFVDADDYLEPESAAKLLAIVEKIKPQILWFDHRLVDERYNVLPLPAADHKNVPQNIIYTGKEFLSTYFGNSCMPCMFLFSRTYILKNNFSFEEGKYLEDVIFTSVAIDKAESVCYTNILAYNYLIRQSGSTMRDETNKTKRIQDSLYIAKMMKLYAEAANTPDYFENFASDMTIYNLRQSAKVSYTFFQDNYDYCRMNHLLPVKINGAVSTIITKVALNILRKNFYSIAKSLN